MQPRIIRLFFATFMSLLLLILLEVATSALLPALGWESYRLSFNVVIILFIALRINNPLMPWFILFLQMVHSAFSVEGWALGTITGILIGTVVGYLKDIIQFSSFFMTLIIVQIFQLVWYFLTTLIICLKMGSFDKFTLFLSATIPGTFALSLVSPFIFNILEKIWKMPEDHLGRSGNEI